MPKRSTKQKNEHCRKKAREQMPHRCSTEVVVEVVVDQSTSSMSSKSSPEDMMHEEEPYIGIDLGLLGDRRLDGSPSGAAAVCSDGENISNQPKARPAAKRPMSHSNIDNVDHQWPSDLSFFDMTLAQVSLSGSTTHACICLLYTSPSPRDGLLSRMPSSA